MGAASDDRVHDDPQVPYTSQSGQMSIRRLTGALKTSSWSNVYPTTYRNS
jgi:hypothetical protein